MDLPPELHILLADDDIDDCYFFKHAIVELPFPVNFTAVHDGEELMEKLTNEIHQLPHVIFLDLNMPRKNGFECLSEIKLNNKLQQLPVIVFSTSFEQGVIDQLYLNGAHYFIRKPAGFIQYKKLIYQTLVLIKTALASGNTGSIAQPEKENFVFRPEK